MNLLHSQNRINELMSQFVTQIRGATAMGRTDLNLVAETILIPLFSEVFSLNNLENLNNEKQNFPGIDLGDRKARIAFQITSTSSSDKVKHTLRKFVDHKHYEEFDKLFIYMLAEKQKSYSGSGYEEIIQETFKFDKNTDIIDYQDILKKVSGFQLDKTSQIERILDNNFGSQSILLFESQAEVEKIYLNLLNISFPETLYVADIAFDRKEIIANSKNHQRKVRNRSSTRKVAQAALEQLGLGFKADWVCHENKIITFHDLNDTTLPLSQIIDLGTITPLSSEEFYEIDEDYNRIFKNLLWRCLQQKLYSRNVQWQNEERLFIFSPPNDGGDIRKESWKDKKASSRMVFQRTRKKDNADKTWYCKHLGFRIKYKMFNRKWYLQIKPDWFFSFNGYKKSFYHNDKVDWLKKQEDNSQVMYQLKFIVYFLTDEPQVALFSRNRQYPFLSFGSLVEFSTAPKLDDSDWKPTKGAIPNPLQKGLFKS